jgi:TIR domain
LPIIAISYRRQDTSDIATRIYDYLVDRYGRSNVFIDIDKIPRGVDFREHIAAEFARVDVIVALIGVNWLSRDETGSPRIKEADDPVRIEFEHAKNNDIIIIPALVDGAGMPARRDLPETIADFTYINAADVYNGRDFNWSCDRLCQIIDSHTENKSKADVANEAARTSPAQASHPHRSRRIGRLSFAGWFERAIIRSGPFELSVLALIGGFAMAVGSQLFGLAWLEHTLPDGGTKKVGFLFAPNWFFVFIAILPPFLALLAILMSRWQNAMKVFCEQKLVLARDGSPIPLAAMLFDWRLALERASRLMWIIMCVIIIQSVSQWTTVNYLLLATGIKGNSFVDWGTLAIYEPNKASVVNSMIFTAISYIYLGLSSFVALSVLTLVVTIALFLKSLSDETGRFSLVLSNTVIGRLFVELFTPIYMCLILGVVVAICMRLQVEYRRVDYHNISQLLFSDWLRLLGAQMPEGASKTFIPAEFLSFAELAIMTLVLFLVLYLMYEAFEKARQRYLASPVRFTWPKPGEPEVIAENLEAVRSYKFIEMVVPSYVSMAIILTGMVLSYLMIGYATVWVSTILFAFIRFAVVPAFQGRPGVRSSAESQGAK